LSNLSWSSILFYTNLTSSNRDKEKNRFSRRRSGIEIAAIPPDSLRFVFSEILTFLRIFQDLESFFKYRCLILSLWQGKLKKVENYKLKILKKEGISEKIQIWMIPAEYSGENQRKKWFSRTVLENEHCPNLSFGGI
jgi:hypothetical protein